MRLAVFTTNDPHNYSGGRYHGLILAYAAAAAGIETVMITDHVPAFDADLAPLSPKRKVLFFKTKDFRTELPEGPFDIVVIVPTGIFLPEFYENALAFAGNVGAAVALINFESGNWFNSVAPEPKDIRLWSYWKRVLLDGGLCLSSARESAKWAKDFYRGREQVIRHEVWCPPINSAAARVFDACRKDGSVLAFVRPTDRHKGSQDLLHLRPELFRGRILNLIAGREIDSSFEKEIRDHFKVASEVRFHIRVSDSRKFELMAAASAVLFPSRFEGFGYPPVEAAYCGTESVCFRLPVLEETVGSIAHMAPMGDFVAFNDALAAALKKPERRTTLRAAVERFAEFDNASELLAEIIFRSLTVVPRRKPKSYRAAIGPFAKTSPRKPADFDRANLGAPIPAKVIAAKRTDAGDLAVSIEAMFRPEIGEFSVSVEDGLPCYCIPNRGKGEGGWVRWSLQVLASKDAFGKVIRVVPQGAEADDILIKVESAADHKHELKTLFGSSEIRPSAQSTYLRGWILAEQPVDFIHVSIDGKSWFTAPVSTERKDVVDKNPGYPSRRCGFTIELAAGSDPKSGLIVALETAGGLVDAISGWVPSAKPLFETPDVVEKGSGKSSSPVGEKARVTAPVPGDRLTVKHPVELKIADTTDSYWNRGVLRKGSLDRLGTIRVVATPDVTSLPVRTGIQFASGSLRRITKVEQKGNYVEIGVDGPLSPALDGGKPAQTLSDELATGPDTFFLSEWTDKNWLRGVWSIPGPHWRRSFFIRTDTPNSPKLRAGMLLTFATSGTRRVMEVRTEGKNARVFLDEEIRPFGDGVPNPVKVLAPMTPFEDEFVLSHAERDRETRAGSGISRMRRRELKFLDDKNSKNVIGGTVLRFGSGTLRRVAKVERKAGHLLVTLERPIDSDLDAGLAAVSVADPRRILDGVAEEYIYKVPEFPASKSLFQLLISESRRRGRGLVSTQPDRLERQPRVLVLSLVPHQPANQGNRVVTRNLVEHILSLGFAVDLVIQNWVDPWITFEGHEENLRIIALPFPEWQKTPDVAARKKIQAILEANEIAGVDQPVADALSQSANHFHPFFIARDEMVETSASLIAANKYAAVVVNYTHLIRVLKELESRGPIPPSIVLTHDALSRLPTRFEQQKIDTAYRACAPQIEAAALNAIKGMAVVAISRNEADYFRTIGVTNPICVAEYDGFEEGRQFHVGLQSFRRKTLIFHGSANPMNIAGLNWFVDRCWDQIRSEVPEVRLLICGRICESWTPKMPGIEFIGEVEREEMFRHLSEATIAINPCVAGTGLKIKTVEAACLGLPSVCLPNAIDGLEDVAMEFSVVATSSETFTWGCVKLLNDEGAWRALRKGALKRAETRFSHATVYKDLDILMGWTSRSGAFGVHQSSRDQSEDFERVLAGWVTKYTDASAARSDAEAQIARPVNDATLYLIAAALALRDNEGWQAAVYAATAAALSPANADAYRLLGEGLMSSGLRHEAAEALFQARMLRCNDEKILELLESVCAAGGDTRGSERARSQREALKRPTAMVNV